MAELEDLNAELEGRIEKRTEELRAANEELEKKNRELIESRERLLLSELLAERGRLIGEVAHELNTPLGALISASASLTEETRSSVVCAMELAAAARPSGGEAQRFEQRAELLLNLVERGLFLASRYPDGAPSRKEASLLLSRLERRHIPRGEELRDDLIELGFDSSIPEGLLDNIEAELQLVRVAVLIVAPAKSAAIAKTSAERAAAAIRLLLAGTRHDSLAASFSNPAKKPMME
jgi:signal transduction histidine kinase